MIFKKELPGVGVQRKKKEKNGILSLNPSRALETWLFIWLSRDKGDDIPLISLTGLLQITNQIANVKTFYTSFSATEILMEKLL